MTETDDPLAFALQKVEEQKTRVAQQCDVINRLELRGYAQEAENARRLLDEMIDSLTRIETHLKEAEVRAQGQAAKRGR